MGIDRWKQEHRNWRPSGVRHVVPEAEPNETAVAPIEPSEKALNAKPRAAKKQSSSSSSRAMNASDKAQPKRSKR